MQVNRLVEVCPPPATVRQIPAPWETIEAELGYSLSREYEEVVRCYGPGAFKDFLYVFQPRHENPHIDVACMAREVAEAVEVERLRGTLQAPFAVERLQVVGGTDNGDYIHLVADSKGKWKTCVNESDSHEWFVYDGDLASFLFDFVSGSLEIPMFPRDLREVPATFTPLV